MGVVVRRYMDILITITYPYSTCISAFLAAASLLLRLFLKCFFILVILDRMVEFADVKILNNKKFVQHFIQQCNHSKIFIRNSTNQVEEEDSHLLDKGWNILQGQNYSTKRCIFGPMTISVNIYIL